MSKRGPEEQAAVPAAPPETPAPPPETPAPQTLTAPPPAGQTAPGAEVTVLPGGHPATPPEERPLARLLKGMNRVIDKAAGLLPDAVRPIGRSIILEGATVAVLSFALPQAALVIGGLGALKLGLELAYHKLQERSHKLAAEALGNAAPEAQRQPARLEAARPEAAAPAEPGAKIGRGARRRLAGPTPDPAAAGATPAAPQAGDRLRPAGLTVFPGGSDPAAVENGPVVAAVEATANGRNNEQLVTKAGLHGLMALNTAITTLHVVKIVTYAVDPIGLTVGLAASADQLSHIGHHVRHHLGLGGHGRHGHDRDGHDRDGPERHAQQTPGERRPQAGDDRHASTEPAAPPAKAPGDDATPPALPRPDQIAVAPAATGAPARRVGHGMKV